MMNYIYGPVPSRRLGFSLGIDIVPYKTCTLDCIYCQIGRTTCKSRGKYADKIKETLKDIGLIAVTGAGGTILMHRLYPGR